MLQLRVRMLQIKILHVSTKAWCSQINKYVWKKKEGNLGSRRQGRMPCDDRDRDWSYLARSQGMPRIADSCQKLAEKPETDSSSEPLLLLLSHFSRVWLCATPWTAAYQAPPSMGFSRQEYWSGVLLSSLKCLHNSFKWYFLSFQFFKCSWLSSHPTQPYCAYLIGQKLAHTPLTASIHSWAWQALFWVLW